MQLMTTEDAVVQTLTATRDHGRPAPSGYLLAAGMNMVASSLQPSLDRLCAAGLIVQVGANLAAGVEEMPGDQRWALTEKGN